MTVVEQEYCCVRPMRYLGEWPVVQGGHQHKWKCDRCGKEKRIDAIPHWSAAANIVNHTQA